MPEFGTDDERLYVNRQDGVGFKTFIETDLGSVTIDLADADGDFELRSGKTFKDLSRGDKEKLLMEQAKVALQRYHEHYRDRYGGDAGY